LGRPWRTDQGDQVAADEAWSAGDPPETGSRDVGVAHQDAAQLHLSAVCGQQEPHDPLAEYSRDCLRALRGETAIRYDERSRGTLQLFRAQAQLDGTASDIAVLKHYGVPYEVLDRDGCVGAEPALAAVKHKFAGGLRLPQDETGDCHMFTQALAAAPAKLGVQFRLGTNGRASDSGHPRDHWCCNEGGGVSGRRLCGRGSGAGRRGCSARSAFRSRSIPVKGYSITGRSLTRCGTGVDGDG